MTPYEFRLILENYYDEQKREQEDKITLAYMTAMWAAQWFSKKHPKPLDEILNHKEQPKQMTDEQMFAVIKALNDAMGGEVNGSC